MGCKEPICPSDDKGRQLLRPITGSEGLARPLQFLTTRPVESGRNDIGGLLAADPVNGKADPGMG